MMMRIRMEVGKEGVFYVINCTSEKMVVVF